MKALLLLAVSSAALAQAPPPAPGRDSVRVAVHSGSDTEEMHQLLSVLRVEKLHIKASSPQAAGKRFHLTYQEYRQGVPGPEKELVGDAARLTSFDPSGQFRLDVFARPVTETQVEAQFRFANGRNVRSFRVLPGRGDQYSMRTDIWPYRPRPGVVAPGQQPTQERNFPIGQKIPFLVYTLPYEQKGWLLYCQLAQSKVPVSEWFAKFQIPHFIVYNLTIE